MIVSDAIPARLLDNPNAGKLVEVLDQLKLYKDEQGIAYMENVYNPLLNRNLEFLRKFLWDYGQIEWMEGMPIYLYERLILNACDIMDYKGSPRGLKLWLRCVADADVVIKTDEFFKEFFISPGDYAYGYLPNATDLGIDGVLKLPDDFGSYHDTLEFKMVSRYFHLSEVREFISRSILNYLPVISDMSSTVNLYFYRHAHTHSQDNHFWIQGETDFPESDLIDFYTLDFNELDFY